MLADLVERTVFLDWWTRPFELPQVMRALDMTVGYETLEFQGALDAQGAPQYLLLWDAKGRPAQPSEGNLHESKPVRMMPTIRNDRQ
jgi:hypothetical protein